MSEREYVEQSNDADEQVDTSPGGEDTAHDDDNEPFDPERAKAKIRKANNEAKNLRKRIQELEPLAAKARELEDASKSDLQRLQEASESHKTRAEKSESALLRLQTALDRAPEGATIEHIRAVAKRATGETEEDLASDVDELFGLIMPKQSATPPRKPQERLRGGGDPDEEPDDLDPGRLAAKVRRQ